MTPPVLFDLDGTLVDSRPGIVAAVNATLRSLGVAERPLAEIEANIGPPLHETFARYLGRDPREPALEEVVAAYRARYARVMVDGAVVYDGIPALLDALLARGHVVAVATSKSQPLAHGLLAGVGLAGRFAAILGPVPPSREDKAGTVGRALAAVGGGRAVMVGDRFHDVEGAAAHGLRCIGAAWGIGGARQLRAAGAWALAATPGDVLGLVAASGSAAA